MRTKYSLPIIHLNDAGGRTFEDQWGGAEDSVV
jgi:hypothetical protein